jgi:hypothetical protein
MVKYARMVFEEEIPDDATPEEALRILSKSMKSYLDIILSGDHPSTEDLEISEYQYERME